MPIQVSPASLFPQTRTCQSMGIHICISYLHSHAPNSLFITPKFLAVHLHERQYCIILLWVHTFSASLAPLICWGSTLHDHKKSNNRLRSNQAQPMQVQSEYLINIRNWLAHPWGSSVVWLINCKFIGQPLHRWLTRFQDLTSVFLDPSLSWGLIFNRTWTFLSYNSQHNDCSKIN